MRLVRISDNLSESESIPKRGIKKSHTLATFDIKEDSEGKFRIEVEFKGSFGKNLQSNGIIKSNPIYSNNSWSSISSAKKNLDKIYDDFCWEYGTYANMRDTSNLIKSPTGSYFKTESKKFRQIFKGFGLRSGNDYGIDHSEPTAKVEIVGSSRFGDMNFSMDIGNFYPVGTYLKSPAARTMMDMSKLSSDLDVVADALNKKYLKPGFEASVYDHDRYNYSVVRITNGHDTYEIQPTDDNYWLSSIHVNDWDTGENLLMTKVIRRMPGDTYELFKGLRNRDEVIEALRKYGLPTVEFEVIGESPKYVWIHAKRVSHGSGEYLVRVLKS